MKIFESAKRSGYVRVRVDGNLYELDEEIKLDKNQKHNIEIIIDRLIIRPDIRQRLADSVETALTQSGGLVIANLVQDEQDILFSRNYACEDCGISIEELTPRMFSFNNPFGFCNTCAGLGVRMKADVNLIIPDENLSIMDGAIQATGWNAIRSDGISRMYFEALSKKYKFDLKTPWKDLSKDVKNIILHGTKGEKLELNYDQPRGKGVLYQSFEGICENIERRYRETQSDSNKRELEELMSESPCPSCKGRRLRKEALAVTVGDKNIYDFTVLSVEDELNWIENLKLTDQQNLIAGSILKEINSRLKFLKSVGLGYLTLSRSAGTLSGGESQRIRLATQIGSSLTGVLYILDEPSIGLHQRDNSKLLATLRELRDLGNTLLVVEHDEETMRAADYLVDIGPGAGVHGGEVVAAGTPEEVMQNPNSLTGLYLSGKEKIPVPEKRRTGNGKYLKIIGAAENNLRNININFPLGVFTVVTGVSGSGKSSLVNEVLFKRLGADLMRMKIRPGKCKKIQGLEYLDKAINIDQSPIGRTPRSNPATYTGLFQDIRNLFAATQDAKSRGYGPGRFSFNVRGGRCEACCGDGVLKIEMHFLPDVFVPCEVCHGKRYNHETLEVRYKGKNIAEVLDMTVDEALIFFAALPKLKSRLETLHDVGLGYIKLGQPSTELSGGEAQRVKLATELSRQATGRTIYILDEPTTGLHPDDLKRLLYVLQRLTDAGNTVIVIEHNLDIIKCADYVIDLGPEGGYGGGNIVAMGTPEEVAQCEASYTGQYLRRVLNK